MARSASAQTICGSLPAELQHAALHPLGAQLAHPAPDLDRAGEEDLRGRRLAQRLPHRAATVHGADQALRKAGIVEDPLDSLAQQGRQARRLQHHPVARDQRQRHLAERDRPRVVPGRDHADDAERLVGEEAALGLQERLRVTDPLVGEDLGRRARAPAQRVDGGDQLHHVALGDRLALLAGEQGGDLLHVADQDVGGASHVARAIGERELRPEGLHGGDLVDDPLNLIGRDRLHRADQLPRGRVEGLELSHAAADSKAPWRVVKCVRPSPALRRERAEPLVGTGGGRVLDAEDTG